MDYKVALGIASSIVSLIGYIPYLRDIFRGKNKPHIFSWIVWGMLATIGFFAQTAKGAGPGAWSIGFSAFLCATVVVCAFFRGEKNITLMDWVSFSGALLALVLWAVTKNPFNAILLAIVTDVFAFFPTIRKSYAKPYEESLTVYVFCALQYAISLFAIVEWNPTTFLYPFALVGLNATFVGVVLLRRASVK